MAAQTRLWNDPTISEKAKIIETVFGPQHGPLTNFEEYLSFYTKEISVLREIKHWSKNEDDWSFPIKSHLQMLGAIECVQGMSTSTMRSGFRQTLKHELKLYSIGGRELDAVIDLALRLWLVANFRDRQERGLGGGRPCLQWRDDESLPDCLRRLFPIADLELAPSQRRLHPRFMASTLVDVCGLRINWTSSLEDHLQLDRHQKTLWVFHSREVLTLFMDSAKNKTASSSYTQRMTKCPLPVSLYEETLRTLDLLFPLWDTSTKRLLRDEGKSVHALNPGDRYLDLKHFPYWQERLLGLYEEVYQAPAEGWSQLWRDRRDPLKFWTFWIALLVLWMTIISTVASVVQTWATLKSTC